MDDFYTRGNSDLIKLNKIAFLCSRRCPAGVVLKAYDWAIEQRDKGNCVISGFHSQIEKLVTAGWLRPEGYLKTRRYFQVK